MQSASSDQARSEVNRIFMELFELKEEQLKPESHLFNDLGLDSLDAIDMAIRFQRELKLQPTHEDIKGIQTMSDIYQLVERFMGEQKTA